MLTFELPPQEKDLVVAGPLDVDLWITTTGTDAEALDIARSATHQVLGDELEEGYRARLVSLVPADAR